MAAGLAELALNTLFSGYEGEIFRLVEGQHFIATRKLVDNDDEQRLLEDILDAAKPIAPTRNSRGALHYLLYTPFRYPPLKTGGRFHIRTEQSIFYGSQDLRTAMAEVAYSRFQFMQHTQAQCMPMDVAYTHFVARVQSERAINLTEPPFTEFGTDISHPASYTQSQLLGAAMRQAGAELFAYTSARRMQGVNIGLFSPEAFQHNKPLRGRDGHWSVYIATDTVEFKRAQLSLTTRETHSFALNDFCIEGRFTMAV